MNKKVSIPKNVLEDLYTRRFLSPSKIANKFGCDPQTIRNRVREYKLIKHTPAMARMKYKKINFSENPIEKAYILGFRLGDLNVYRRSNISETIIARCNTTTTAQVNLLLKVFSKYGKVTVSVGKKYKNVNCFLNNSFSFLLPKGFPIPEWVNKDGETGYSFIAGYADAEGSFGLNQGKARFKIDSYDKIVLFWISSFLKEHVIDHKIRQIASKGDFQPPKYKYNGDLWRLNINKAPDLFKFIEKIDPFLIHGIQRRRMIICKNNILLRAHNGSISL